MNAYKHRANRRKVTITYKPDPACPSQVSATPGGKDGKLQTSFYVPSSIKTPDDFKAQAWIATKIGKLASTAQEIPISDADKLIMVTASSIAGNQMSLIRGQADSETVLKEILVEMGVQALKIGWLLFQQYNIYKENNAFPQKTDFTLTTDQAATFTDEANSPDSSEAAEKSWADLGLVKVGSEAVVKAQYPGDVGVIEPGVYFAKIDEGHMSVNSNRWKNGPSQRIPKAGAFLRYLRTEGNEVYFKQQTQLSYFSRVFDWLVLGAGLVPDDFKKAEFLKYKQQAAK